MPRRHHAVLGQGDTHGRLLVEPLHESFDEWCGDVLYDHDWRRKIRTETGEQFDQRRRAAGRRTHHDALDSRVSRDRAAWMWLLTRTSRWLGRGLWIGRLPPDKAQSMILTVKMSF